MKFKKLIPALLLIGLCCMFFSCTNETNTTSATDELSLDDVANITAKPKRKTHFAFRWAGLPGNSCACPDCKCSGCPCPLGMCGCINGITVNETTDMGPYVGSADLIFIAADTAELTFYQNTDVTDPSFSPDPFVPISGDLSMSDSLCYHFGASSITLHEGFYDIDFSSETYGVIKVPCTVAL